MNPNTQQPSPIFVVCRCRHCDGGIEFDASQAGQEVSCPQCGLETMLYVPAGNQLPPIIESNTQPPSVSEPIWYGSEASTAEVRLTSGAIIKFKSMRLYEAAELNELAAQKTRAASLLNGVSSPYGAIGDPMWVIFMTKITQKIEQVQSREAAQEGFTLIQNIAARERKLRANVRFFPVGQIDEMESAVPSLWTVLREKVRFVNGDEDFITVKDTEDIIRKFRWSCVETYDYDANK
jgi:hypothetical protein